MATRRRWLNAAVFAASLGFTSIASAEPSKEDVAKADALFTDAQALMQKGQYSEACTRFAESQRLDPANGTLLNLALCHEKDGKTATAYKELQELLAIMSSSKSPDDRERSRVAGERLKQLEKKVPRVTLDVSALPKDATLKLDGEPADPASPALVDPGTHTVVATAPQKKPGETSFEVKDASPITVKLEALADEGPPETPAPPPPKEKPKEKYWSDQRILGAGIAGVGLVGVGVGTFFGLDTFSKRDDRDSHCVGTTCDADGIRLHDEAGTSATISTIAFAVGAVALAAGAYLFFTAPSGPPAWKVKTAASF